MEQKYNKSPCNLDDCDNWIKNPDKCQNCMDTAFVFETKVTFKMRLKMLFYKWNSFYRCPKCKSKELEEKNHDYLDGYGSPCLEYDVVCSKCGNITNHYAYGYMQVPETRIGYIKWIWCCGRPAKVKGYLRMIVDTIKTIFWI